VKRALGLFHYSSGGKSRGFMMSKKEQKQRFFAKIPKNLEK
jgi:hypothetical protein